MNLKKYMGNSFQAAMVRAKAELGNDVILVESRKIENEELASKGLNLVEVTVASEAEGEIQVEDYGYSLKSNQVSNQDPDNFQNIMSLLNKNPILQSENKNQSEKESDLLREEIRELKNKIRKLTRFNFPEVYSKVYDQLLSVGIENDLAASLIRRSYLDLERVEDVNVDQIRYKVGAEVVSYLDQFSYLHQKNSILDKQIIAFIGPTGVGKTSTIMKMAINNEIFPNKKVGIISTDRYRLGAFNQIESFSRIAGVPFVGIRNSLRIKQEVVNLSRKVDVILIDTPGNSPDYENEQQTLFQIISPTDTYLVLNLNRDINDMNFSLHKYYDLNPTGTVITKVDESRKWGKILTMVAENEIPIAYICNGQSIPDEIQKVKSSKIWEMINKQISRV